MTAEEARVRGTYQALLPVLDVARDFRWGRVEETFGEDPYLVAQMGIAAVKGFRGDGSINETTATLVDVTNIGTKRGDEVVQMYIRDKVSSVTHPVKELKGFQRITIEPCETKTIKLSITSEQLSFYDINMNYVIEPGEFEIMIGSSSRDKDLQSVILTVE